jgi:hypothetical protein
MFFFNQIGKRATKRGTGSFPFLIRMKEIIGEQLEMFPNTKLEAVHLTNKCAEY